MFLLLSMNMVHLLWYKGALYTKVETTKEICIKCSMALHNKILVHIHFDRKAGNRMDCIGPSFRCPQSTGFLPQRTRVIAYCSLEFGILFGGVRRSMGS